ncbi:MAG: TIGR04290 family methyltransferase [Geminicoccaceae bacterium]|nr:TIGR04290 family methyltransferase [Geminicoccaceae bacterium]
MSGDEGLRGRIEDLGPWFHNLDIEGVRTAPYHPLGDYPAFKWRRFADLIPADLKGRTVLDIGCNAGFYAFEMKRRGAERVVGIDGDGRYLRQAAFAADALGLDVEFRELSVYEVDKMGERFDLVLFMGVLYHLRHPLLALDLIHAHATSDLLVFQSLLRGEEGVLPVADDHGFEETAVFGREGYPVLHFVEHRYAGDPTNWWIPNRACAEAMLRSAGFSIQECRAGDTYLCRRGAVPKGFGDLAGAAPLVPGPGD